MARTRSQPSHYPPIPFHVIRLCCFVATIIVGSIMAYFIVHLHQDNFKIPFTFIVLLVTAVFGVFNLILTTLINCCSPLSPLLSLVTNSIIAILWIVSLGMLSWSMSGTVKVSCTTANWGTSTGVHVCQVYKALFSFVVIGMTCQVAAVILDIRVRRSQAERGVYNNVVDPQNRNSAFSTGSDFDPKADPSDPFPFAGSRFKPKTPAQAHTPDVPLEPYRSQNTLDEPNWNAALEHHHASEADTYYDHATSRGVAYRYDASTPQVREGQQEGLISAQEYGGYGYPQHPANSTSYDAGQYHDSHSRY